MKKISLILVLIITMFCLSDVNACPHVDSKNESHFQFYNEDYTVMSLLYPRQYYLYGKDVPCDTSGLLLPENEDKVYKEAFSFSLALDLDAYYSNYWFMDQNLQSENWEKLDLKTTVKDLENLSVSGKNYNLNVFLKNTYNYSLTLMDNKVYQMYYNVYVDRLNDDSSETFYHDIIKKNKFKLLVDDILKIDTVITVTDNEEYDFALEKIEVKKLYDEIEVKIKSDKLDKEVVAINLDNIKSSNLIDCIYEVDSYKFNIKEPGVYILISKDTVIDESINEDKIIIDYNVKEEKENSINIRLYVLIISGVVLIISILIILFIKTIKKQA